MNPEVRILTSELTFANGLVPDSAELAPYLSSSANAAFPRQIARYVVAVVGECDGDRSRAVNMSNG